MIAHILQRHMGHGRRLSVQAVHEITGIPVSTLKAYRSGAKVSHARFQMLVDALGAAFLNDWLRHMGYAPTRVLEDTATAHELNASTSAVIAEYGRAMADGHIDHCEHRRLRQVASEHAPVVQQFLAG